VRIYDNIAQLSTTTGAGDFTLSTTIPGYYTFDDFLSYGNYIPYMIEAIDGSGVRTGEWESGIGVYASANTLERTIVSNSSDYGNPITFSAGTKRVSLCLTERCVRHVGALVSLSVADTTDYTSGGYISWDAESYDFALQPWHSTVTNPSRMTVPEFVEYARFSAGITIFHATAMIAQLELRVNGAAVNIPRPHARAYASSGTMTTTTLSFITPPMTVNGGDYYELRLMTGVSGSSIDYLTSWFHAEAVLF
jgi:hypothetical protein